MIAAIKKNITPAKALLLAAGFTSSCFVGFWMFVTMPAGMPFILQAAIALMSAIVFDGIISYTAFSKNQGVWNWLTSVTALFAGVLVTLALFYDHNWSWLHITFVVMVFLFSRFIASERHDTVMIQTDTTEALITRLVSSGLNNTQIYNIIGGNRNKVITMTNTIRSQIDTDKNVSDAGIVHVDTMKE